jgi:5-methylcytosine-specific restriction endonuclease McrA
MHAGAPLCECHAEPMGWQKRKDLRAGGYWYCRVKRRQAYPASSAPADAPLCECHGEPMGWNKSTAVRAGGRWYCRVERRWRSAHLEDQRKREREYRASDPERRSADFKRWCEENPEKWRESYQRWEKTNPTKVRAKWKRNTQRRRALKSAVLHEPWTIAEVEAAYGSVCYLCGEETIPDGIHADHIIPLSRGGPDILTNIRLTHPFCNGRKKDRLLEELTDVFPGAAVRAASLMS